MPVINCSEVQQAKKMNYRNTQSWPRFYVNVSEFHSFKKFPKKNKSPIKVDTEFSSYEALEIFVATLIKVQRVCFTNQTLNIYNNIYRNGSNKRLHYAMGRCTQPL